MTNSSKDRYFGNVAKSRRSSPGESQDSVFFQGQGGRTVLSLSDSFPTLVCFPGLFFHVELQKSTHSSPQINLVLIHNPVQLQTKSGMIQPVSTNGHMSVYFQIDIPHTHLTLLTLPG